MSGGRGAHEGGPGLHPQDCVGWEGVGNPSSLQPEFPQLTGVAQSVLSRVGSGCFRLVGHPQEGEGVPDIILYTQLTSLLQLRGWDPGKPQGKPLCLGTGCLWWASVLMLSDVCET